MTTSILGHTGTATGSALASWTPLTAMLGVFAVAVAALLLTNRRAPLASRAAATIERVTGVPGWAGATVGTALFGLLLAGQGFYSDVAWHVALGRDEVLFTAPHTSIFVGLQLILLSGACAVWFATATGVPTRWRAGRLRVPFSALPLLALGGAAVAGFPLDEVWHRAYGIDVTMWSPTHMLMILGASFTGAAAWLVLGEAGVGVASGGSGRMPRRTPDAGLGHAALRAGAGVGVASGGSGRMPRRTPDAGLGHAALRAGAGVGADPRSGAWARGMHVLAAALVVQGLSAPLGEFAFGVPQFQQLFHPVLLCVAAAFSFVVARLVLGRGWAFGAALAAWALNIGMGGGESVVETREAGVFVVSALVVEAVALLAGVERRFRFAVLSAVGVGTAGLAGEWLWNQGAYQPWHASLLPEAVVLGVVGALAAAVAAVPFAAAAAGRDEPDHDPRVPRWSYAAAAVAIVVVVLVPMPRRVGDVHAAVRLLPPSSSPAGVRTIEVTLTPADAAKDARWFQASSWQGGGLVVRDMVEVGRGRYRSDGPVPVDGRWKSLLRLHRGDELMTLPLYLPADPAIGEPEIPAVDRSGQMQPETRYLLRETREGDALLKWVVHGLLALAAVVWLGAFAVGVRGVLLVRRGGFVRAVDVRGPHIVTAHIEGSHTCVPTVESSSDAQR